MRRSTIFDHNLSRIKILGLRHWLKPKMSVICNRIMRSSLYYANLFNLSFRVERIFRMMRWDYPEKHYKSVFKGQMLLRNIFENTHTNLYNNVPTIKTLKSLCIILYNLYFNNVLYILTCSLSIVFVHTSSRKTLLVYGGHGLCFKW